jgi:NitT/TauT family transport system substrate-binding protein
MKSLKQIMACGLLMLMACSGLQAQETVRITNIGRGYYAGPLYVAMRERLFEKYGLKADVTFVKGGALAFQSVFTRDADFGVLSYEHILTGAAQGRNLVSIFNVTNRPLNNIVVSEELFQANKDKTLKEKILALKGARIGAPSAGGSGEKMLGVLGRDFGLDMAKQTSLVFLGTEAASYVGAFQTKTINVAIPFEPAGVMVQQKGLGRTLVNLMNGEVERFRDLIFMTLATHPTTLKDKPELVKKVVAVFAEAQAILLDPNRGPQIMGAEFSEMNAASNQQAYDVVRPIWSSNGRMSLEGAKKVNDYLQPTGTVAIDFGKTFTNQFLPEK